MNMACELSISRSCGKVVLPELDIAQRERGKPLAFPSNDDVIRDIPLWANYSGGLMFYALKKVRFENESGLARAIRRAKSILATVHESPKVAFLYSVLNVQSAKRNPAEAGRMPWVASVEYSLRTGMQLVSDALCADAPPCPAPTPRVAMVSEYSLPDLALYKTVVATGNLEVVPASMETALRQFVARGGRLLCFGPLGRINQRGQERPGKCLDLLPCRVEGVTRGKFTLTFVQGETLGALPVLDLSDTRFRAWYALTPNDSARVLAHFADGSPAIVSDASGQVVVLAFDPGPVYAYVVREHGGRARALQRLMDRLLTLPVQ
ncbi:MAG TPA: hypothetical protein EYP10_10515 [Armatimonadetes bacterium]|nr:hypothetical protein [Armatimonadota bacterium]